MNTELSIGEELFNQIVAHAREAAPDECLGFLARRQGGPLGRLTAACLLPATATPSRAEASPLDISAAVAAMRKRGLVPAALWHSHGDGQVHHSSVDDETVPRLLPAMAEWNFARPRAEPFVPCVVARDEADLPLNDGTTLRVTVLGPVLPGFGARERIAWSFVKTRFREPAARPRAVQEGGRLHLSAGPVVLTLGVPPGATLECRVVDHALVRSACLHSLVVNTRGEAYAEALEFHDIAGRPIIQKHACSVVIVPARANETTAPRGVNGDHHHQHDGAV